MHFFGYFRSSAAYRCRIAFNLKNLTPDFTSVHLRKDGGQHKLPEFLALNPQGLVPALKTDDGDVLTQSLAIIEWLDETYPEPRLLPDAPIAKANVRAFASVIASEIHPLQNLRVLSYLREEFDQDQAGIDAWCGRWISDGLSACEGILAKQDHGGNFCFGDTPGLADICLVPQVHSASRFHVELTDMPNVRRIFENCEKLPAFANAQISKQPDAED